MKLSNKENNKISKELTRNSNFELMRITSMIFIIIYHIIMRGGIHNSSSGITGMLVTFLTSLVIVHVNSFVLITGYFQCKSNLKVSKAISINNAVWFYKVLFLILFLVIIHYFPSKLTNTITNLEILKTFIPLDYGIYWYIDIYLVLYLISPFINKLINNINKKDFQKLLVVLFVLFSIIPTLTQDEVIYSNAGRTIMNFVLLYLIGAYLRTYPIEKNYIFSKFTNNARRIIFLLLFIFGAFLTTFCHITFLHIVNFGTLGSYLGNTINWFYYSFGSPIIIMQSIAYFLFFETLNLKSKLINWISKYTLGVYLIHENIYVRDNIYNLLGFTDMKINIKIIPIILCIALIIFIVCIIIEFLRQVIFKFIYQRKISIKFRKWYRNYFKRLGININW